MSALTGSFDEESEGGMSLFLVGSQYPVKWRLERGQAPAVGTESEDSLPLNSEC